MTVVVAFHCADGVVIAADSMLTSSMGNLPVAHHTGRKVSVLDGNQVFAFAGDQGQGERFKIMANGSHNIITQTTHPIDYPIAISKAIIGQFQSTGIGNAINLSTVLAFQRNGEHQCCIFDGPVQPRLMDRDHFYYATGSGKLHADPFLRFLVDTFCATGQPSVREAIFLATWAVEHVIATNPGGVAGPIRIGVLEPADPGLWAAREVPDDEIEEHRQAMESAKQALRTWRDEIQSGDAAADTPPVPEMAPPIEHPQP